MDDPVSEITGVIQKLCTSQPKEQNYTIEKYFTHDAAFTHPFCRTGSNGYSRWLVQQIYLWYKVLSPTIEVHVDSIAFDKENLLLYVGIHQTFKIWVVPFYKAQPHLVTVLTLTHDGEEGPESKAKSYAEAVKDEPSDGQPESSKRDSVKLNTTKVAVKKRGSEDAVKKYYIKSQNDLYQTDQWIKFLMPWKLGSTLVILWQLWATLFCVLGALIFAPITWAEDRGWIGNVKKY